MSPKIVYLSNYPPSRTQKFKLLIFTQFPVQTVALDMVSPLPLLRDQAPSFSPALVTPPLNR